jgi:hypothetical protein
VLALTLFMMVAMYKFFTWVIKRGGNDMMLARVLEFMDNKDDVVDSADSAVGLW